MFNSKNEPTSIFTSHSFSDFRLCGVPWNQPFLSTITPWNASFSGWWYTYPSEKYGSSSVGMMTFPIEWKNKSHVPVTTNQSSCKTPSVCILRSKTSIQRTSAGCSSHHQSVFGGRNPNFPRAKTPQAQLLHAFALPGACASIGAELHRQTEGIHGNPLRLDRTVEMLGMVISPLWTVVVYCCIYKWIYKWNNVVYIMLYI